MVLKIVARTERSSPMLWKSPSAADHVGAKSNYNRPSRLVLGSYRRDDAHKSKPMIDRACSRPRLDCHAYRTSSPVCKWNLASSSILEGPPCSQSQMLIDPLSQ